MASPFQVCSLQPEVCKSVVQGCIQTKTAVSESKGCRQGFAFVLMASANSPVYVGRVVDGVRLKPGETLDLGDVKLCGITESDQVSCSTPSFAGKASLRWKG